MAVLLLPSPKLRRGGKCYVIHSFLGLSNAKHRKKSHIATSPLPSRVPTRGPKGYATLAFSGFRNAERGDKIRDAPRWGDIAYTHAFALKLVVFFLWSNVL